MNMIDSNFKELSLRSQFQLLNLNRSNYYYYHKIDKTTKDQDLANKIHEIWIKYPFYGYRKITAVLRREEIINHKKSAKINARDESCDYFSSQENQRSKSKI